MNKHKICEQTNYWYFQISIPKLIQVNYSIPDFWLGFRAIMVNRAYLHTSHTDTNTHVHAHSHNHSHVYSFKHVCTFHHKHISPPTLPPTQLTFIYTNSNTHTSLHNQTCIHMITFHIIMCVSTSCSYMEE